MKRVQYQIWGTPASRWQAGGDTTQYLLVRDNMNDVEYTQVSTNSVNVE
jgi:hypothetical protein